MVEKSEKPWMTEDQAEEIVMANLVGRYFGGQSELTHAYLLLAMRDKREEEQAEKE